MNNTNIENVALKFVILLILEYNMFRTLATEYIRLKLVKAHTSKEVLTFISGSSSLI